jgi:hypothetical protein
VRRSLATETFNINMHQATIAATGIAVPPFTLERDDVKKYIAQVFDLDDRRTQNGPRRLASPCRVALNMEPSIFVRHQTRLNQTPAS